MKHCAILSMDHLDDFVSYDDLLDEPLAARGWTTHVVSWRNGTIDWNRFDAVLIRSTWDYQDDPVLFLQVLQRIENSSAQLANPLDLVQWNISKVYLKELSNTGIAIVPTLWPKRFAENDLPGYFETLQSREIVIKPVISANADHTFRLSTDNAHACASELAALFSRGDFMVQPFMQCILEEGEFSLFYFAGEYSHAILKTPKPDDFRVQEEHGGTLLKVEPETELLRQAEKVMQQLSPAPLYARVDFVRSDTGFALMEVELIEPSLYFTMDETSAERFAQAFDTWMAQQIPA